MTRVRCVALRDDAPEARGLTAGREYEALPDNGFGGDFSYIDDDGHSVVAWWNDDPWCRWERLP